jgi:hypothetical protein
MQYRPTNISNGFDKFSLARLAYNAGVHDVPRCPRYNRLLLYIQKHYRKFNGLDKVFWRRKMAVCTTGIKTVDMNLDMD